MGKQPYIPLYIGDWEQDTNTLSLEAEAAWLRIIFKMWKEGKTGVYKIPTKQLQNLWRKNEQQIAEIIDELRYCNICEIIQSGAFTEFHNRRMKKEKNISSIRSKSVQNRYKTEPRLVDEYVNEYVNENEIKTVYPFEGEKFKDIWNKWLQYRKDIKKPYKSPISEQSQLKKLSKYTEDVAIEMIEQSINSGWQGIFEINKKTNGNTNTAKSLFEEALRFKHNDGSSFKG